MTFLNFHELQREVGTRSKRKISVSLTNCFVSNRSHERKKSVARNRKKNEESSERKLLICFKYNEKKNTYITNIRKVYKIWLYFVPN